MRRHGYTAPPPGQAVAQMGEELRARNARALGDAFNLASPLSRCHAWSDAPPSQPLLAREHRSRIAHQVNNGNVRAECWRLRQNGGKPSKFAKQANLLDKHEEQTQSDTEQVETAEVKVEEQPEQEAEVKEGTEEIKEEKKRRVQRRTPKEEEDQASTRCRTRSFTINRDP